MSTHPLDPSRFDLSNASPELRAGVAQLPELRLLQTQVRALAFQRHRAPAAVVFELVPGVLEIGTRDVALLGLAAAPFHQSFEPDDLVVDLDQVLLVLQPVAGQIQF